MLQRSGGIDPATAARILLFQKAMAGCGLTADDVVRWVLWMSKCSVWETERFCVNLSNIWISQHSGRLVCLVWDFGVKPDCFIYKNFFIKRSSLLNCPKMECSVLVQSINWTSEIWTKSFGFPSLFKIRMIWEWNYYVNVRNRNVL